MTLRLLVVLSAVARACNFLDDHGVKPVKVLKKAGLRHETPADWPSGDTVHVLYMASHRFMPQTLHTDSEDVSASDDQPALVDSHTWRARHSQPDDDDDPSFIVLTETKFSFRCIPVWDRYSPHRTRVEKKTHVSSLPGLAFFCNQLAYGRLVIRRAVEMATLGS
jgi:hypothetical protein